MPSNNAEDFFGSWLYKSLMSIRSWYLPTAPAHHLYPDAVKVGSVLGYGLAEVSRSVTDLGDSSVYQAPSPWHAALYCQMLQHHISMAGGRLLFRGQRNYTWPLAPSILRKPDTAAHEQSRTNLFSELMAAMSFNTSIDFHPASGTSNYRRIGKQTYMAAAQHYGLKTYLLDFTTDPDVAVKFATGSGDSDDGMASISILELHTAMENGLSIVLPPPFAPRLHLQRGVFVEAKETLDPKRLNIREIRFPYQPSKRTRPPEKFEVCREHGNPVDILPQSSEMEEVIRVVDLLLSRSGAEPSSEEIEQAAQQLKAHFQEWRSAPEKLWLQYIDTFEDMLYALAYSINEDEQLSMDSEVFAHIVKNNVELCCSIASLYRSLPKEYPDLFPKDKTEHMQKLAVFIDVIASNLGYDHRVAEREYRDAMGLP